MKHSKYIELTSLLKGFSDNAGTLRVLFSKVEAPADPDTLEPGRPNTKKVPSDQAKQHPGFRLRRIMLDNEEKAIRDTLELMAGTVDTWTDENQARVDKELGPTADVRELYSAMSDFMVATESPIDGAGVLYDRIREKVQVWIDQAVEWFPELISPFARKFFKSDYYQLAIDDGRITPPRTWNKSIKDLAVWLSTERMTKTIGDSSNDWKSVDGLFIHNGKPVTAQQLGNAIKW